jgi:hypothetical protein
VSIPADAREVFVDLLQQPSRLGTLLRRLHRLHVLEQIIPDKTMTDKKDNTIMDLSGGNGSDPVETIKGFRTIEHANGFARRYVRDMRALARIVPGQTTRQQVAQLLTPGADAAAVHVRTTGADEGAARVREAVLAAFAPVRAAGAEVTVTSEPLIIQEMSEDLSAFQTRSIVLTLGIVTLLLTAYYTVVRRRLLLGPVAMLPAVVSASATLGAMRLFGFDVGQHPLSANRPKEAAERIGHYAPARRRRQRGIEHGAHRPVDEGHRAAPVEQVSTDRVLDSRELDPSLGAPLLIQHQDPAVAGDAPGLR